MPPPLNEHSFCLIFIVNGIIGDADALVRWQFGTN